MTSISRWRLYCTTENTWVYNWGETDPTQCVNNSGHTVNGSSSQLLETIDSQTFKVSNFYQDTLESSRIVQQTPLIDLKSFHGITTENITSTVGSATITATTNSTPEIKMSIAGTTDVCKLRSAKRGYYTAGLVSEAGIALRIPTQLVSGSILKYGYFDDTNGYYFKLVGSQLNVGIMYNGTETLVTYNEFNRNKLDGSESNGITLDFSKGNIFRVQFTWYGFGQVVFGVIQTDSVNNQKFYPMHVYNTNGNTSCGNPYLPINIDFSSNGSSLTRDVYIAGRQYSILGKSCCNNRNNSFILNNIESTNTNQLFSLRYKTGYKTCPVKIIKINVESNVNILLQIYKDMTLSGSSFVNNTYCNESCLQVSTAGTASDGTVYKSWLLFANDQREIIVEDFDMYEDDTLTFTWKSYTSTNSIDISVEWSEKW